MIYNLLTEKWIPVVDHDGNESTIAPWEVADKKWADIVTVRPDFRGALHEFLIGLFQTACAPKDEREWQQNLEPSKEALRAQLEKLAPAFNLNGDGFRFLQDASTELSGTKRIEQLLFDSPADPRDYSWRTTWFAEHKDESTLCFYATDFAEEPVGPGICLSTYGGAMFLYPPIAIPDIWRDPRLDFTNTLEERLLAAACLHSQCPQIALVSAAPPGPAWRQLAKSYGKKWVHLPLGRFSDSTIQQLRMVHVLNGKQVRSYAADFIRRS